MRYYTLFEDGKLFTDLTNDMNSTEDWATSGIVFTSRKLAEKARKYWSDPVYELGEITVGELSGQAGSSSTK